ncbi:FAD/NAD(P)-binding domain-containing protein [Coniophora puteana RWD-64-598 SS2]|uniref:FAD/NAD(P)-binding domain-containing protein n=1 Tax=Coniophora puteana (strain RWD-64-598) TaxID=741705 RepID=A0A5M3MJT4_CONPW|nr:FAD/NAD(P)-binding domain-containing protein [Coniophora puteana RWD-64-598 SS2]EIW79267.1 FAD/NAD(P)-binding domain-containing protein [Coniophora puteana RWD-64-598 SS2]
MTAPLTLDVIVVGAGLSGIATAYRLQRAGHRVTVFDDRDETSRGCTAVHLPCNLARILHEWGFKEQIDALAFNVKNINFHSLDSGELLGCAEWPDDLIDEIGAPYHIIQWRDLYTMLYVAATDAGVQFHYNTNVVGVLNEPPRVELAGGKTITADFIIGTDGPNGIVRALLFGEAMLEPEGHTIYTGTVSRDELANHPELLDLTDPSNGNFQIWAGTSRHCIGMPMLNGAEYVVQVWQLNDDIPDEGAEGWDAAYTGPRPKVGDLRLQRLVDLCTDMRRVKVFKPDCPEEWADDTDRILLVGDAVHYFPPGLVQSAAVHLEDIEILGVLLSRLTSWEQLSHLIRGYQEIREPRFQQNEDSWHRTNYSLWLPPGPSQQGRDTQFRRQLEQKGEPLDDEMMLAQFEEVWKEVGYNAREAAEEWWVNWGMLRERSKGRSVSICLAGPPEISGVSTHVNSINAE